MRYLLLSAVTVCAAVLVVTSGCSDGVTPPILEADGEVFASKEEHPRGGPPGREPVENPICRMHHSSDGPFLLPQYDDDIGALQIFPQTDFEMIQFGGGRGYIDGPGATVALYFCEGGYCCSGPECTVERTPDFNGELTSVVVDATSGNYEIYHQLSVWAGSGYWGKRTAPNRGDLVGQFLARTLVKRCLKLPCDLRRYSLDDWEAFEGDASFDALGFSGIMNIGCYRDRDQGWVCSKLDEEAYEDGQVVMFRPDKLIQGELCWNDLSD